MIPQSFIDTLLARVDIVELVGGYVQLKRGGANYSGLCPFHTEKSPSFSVSPTKQFYHCFGCGAHGTALGFVIEHLGLSFPQAVEELARRVGLEVPQEERGASSPEDRKRAQDQRARLHDRLAQAAQFYKRRLRESDSAIAYLKGRGITGESAKRFSLGFAPEGWQPLQAVFGDYESPELVESGLVIHSEEGGRDKRYDRFRNRLMFPILSERGEVLGFGARTLGSDEPKYLNSPETPLFSKGQALYGLFEGRQAIRAAQEVWVVEGYMDVVALAQHGLGHVVATLGTATTPDHLRLLGRLAPSVVFMFDGDAAGRRAAAKALEVSLPALKGRLGVRFAFLPPEHDPDSFVRAFGQQALRDHVAQSTPLSAFLLARAAEGLDLSQAEGRAAATAEARRLLALMPAGDLRQQIARAAAQRFQADPSSLGVLPVAAGHASRVAPKPQRRSTDSPVVPLVERLLALLVRRPEWAHELPQEVLQQMSPSERSLRDWLTERASEGAGYASLFESALQQDPAHPTFALFRKLAAPSPAMDDLMSSNDETIRRELWLASQSLALRALERAASELASQTSPQSLEELRALRGRIAGLRADLAAKS